MDANVIISLIGSLGFPIVCCIAMFYFINNQLKEYNKKVDENTQSLNKLITLVETILRKDV